MPEMYERFLVSPLFRPFAEELLAQASLREGDRLLDVACGTGIVARLAQEALRARGRIVGIDASLGMLAIARTVAPAIEWRHGDAIRLPVDEGEVFDVVTCHQGLQFVPDKAAAIREMRRVVAPSGRLALGTWRPVEDIPLIRDLQRVAERHLGPIVDQRHSFGDGAMIAQLLADAGWDAIRSNTVTRTIRISNGTATFPRLNATALVGMSTAAKAMSDEQRTTIVAAIADDSVDVLDPYRDASDLVFDLCTTIAVAEA
jgi:ubiquinone/menaquinone biosynthesis C-methylase UbiE